MRITYNTRPGSARSSPPIKTALTDSKRKFVQLSWQKSHQSRRTCSRPRKRCWTTHTTARDFGEEASSRDFSIRPIIFCRENPSSSWACMPNCISASQNENPIAATLRVSVQKTDVCRSVRATSASTVKASNIWEIYPCRLGIRLGRGSQSNWDFVKENAWIL